MDDLTITHTDRQTHGEYRAQPAGSEYVGRLTWTGGDRVRIADHTMVPPPIGGRGIAARLVEELVKDAREQGFKIVPQCSYVAAKFSERPEWADVRA